MTTYQKKVISEILQDTASPLQNNERKYWEKKLTKYTETRSPSIAKELEERFGLSVDDYDTDSGELPLKHE